MYTCMSATCNTSIQDFDLLYTIVFSWNLNADWIQTKVGIGGKYNANGLNKAISAVM